MRHFTSRALFGILMLLVARDTVAEENSCSNPECKRTGEVEDEVSLLQVSNKMTTQKDGSLSWMQVSDTLHRASERRNAATSMVSSVRKMVLAALHDTSLAGVTSEALDEIVTLMNGNVINATLQDHKTEQAILTRLAQDAEACTATMLSAFRSDGGIDDLKETAESLNTTHWNCRATQASLNATDQTKCGEFMAFKTELTFPANCAPFPSATETTQKSCLSAFKSWSTNALDEFMAKEFECNKATKNLVDAEGTCSSDQSKWEKDFCDYASKAITTCSTYSSCHSGKSADYHSSKREIIPAEASRKEEYKAATKILCFIKVLKETTTDQTKEFNDCDSLVVDTSILNIDYPDLKPASWCEETYAKNNDCSTHYASGWPEKAPVNACSEC